MHERLSRTHGDAPETEFHACRDQRLLDEVVIANGRAPEGDQHVGFDVARPPDRHFERAHRVDSDAEVDRDAPARLDDPRHGEIVRGDDLRGAERCAWRHKFVAGRNDRNSRAPPDGQLGMVGGGSQRHVARGETASRRKERPALEEVQSSRPQVVSLGHGGRNDDTVGLAAHVLLNDDRVRASRHRRAREDARRLARADDAVERMPR